MLAKCIENDASIADDHISIDDDHMSISDENLVEYKSARVNDSSGLQLSTCIDTSVTVEVPYMFTPPDKKDRLVFAHNSAFQ